MRFHGDFSQNYADDPVTKLGIDAEAHRVPQDVVFLSGPVFFTRKDAEYLAGVAGSRPLLYLQLEEPNYFCLHEWGAFPNEALHRIYTICPYTAEWLNEALGEPKRVPTFFPVNPRWAPPPEERRFDAVYAGSIIGGWITEMVGEIKRHRHAVISHNDSALVTHPCVAYDEKLRIIAQSKVSVIHNLLFLSERQCDKVREQRAHEKNQAFSHIRDRLAPQLKARLFEAALCRSVILCRRDPWNLIEGYFEPEQDFLYFRSMAELHSLIEDVSRNFSMYEGMIESAYRKVTSRYTTAAFLDEVVRPSLGRDALAAEPGDNGWKR